MAKKKKQEEVSEGLPAWMGTYGDMVTLLLCFFVLLFSMSSVDVAKFKAAMSSFADQIDVLPGGETLTDGDLLNNGISQLNDIVVVFQGAMAWDSQGDESTSSSGEQTDNQDTSKDNKDAAAVDPYKKAAEVAQDFAQMLVDQGIAADVQIKVSSNYVKFTLQGEFLFDSGRADLKPVAKETIGKIAAKAAESQYDGYNIEIEGHTDNLPISSTRFPDNRVLSYYRAHAVYEELTNTYGFNPARIAETGYGEFRPIESNDTVEGRAANRRVVIKIILDDAELSLDEYSLDQLDNVLNESDTSVDGTN